MAFILGKSSNSLKWRGIVKIFPTSLSYAYDVFKPSKTIPGRLYLYGSKRQFGIFDRIQDKLMEKQASNEAKQMRKQFKEMAALETFDLNHFSKQLEEGMSSWLSKIPGLRSQPEVEKATKTKKILDAMTEQEKAKPKFITKLQRQRIAKASEQSEQDVEDLLFQFEKSTLLHRWLRNRVAKKKRIPKSQEELMELAASTRTEHQFLTETEKKLMRSQHGRQARGNRR